MKQNYPLTTKDGRETEMFHHPFNKHSFSENKIHNNFDGNTVHF